MKKCPKCGRELPEEMFGKDKKAKDGLLYLCKDCKKEYNKYRYLANRESILEKQRQHYLNHKVEKAEYGKQYRANHKSERNEYSKKYYENNKEKCIERHKEWLETHKDERAEYFHKYYDAHKEEHREYNKRHYENHKTERMEYYKQYSRTTQGKAAQKAAQHNYNARKIQNGGSFSADEWIDVCIKFDDKCAYCGKETKLTADHIIPVSKGGSSNINNIIPCCQSCNSSKHNSDLGDWYPKQPFFSQERYNKIIDYMLSHKQEER